MWDPRIVANLANFDREEIPAAPPENLPLLDEMRKKLPDGNPFAGVDALFIQHQLGPFIPRLKAMFASGLDPERCWFVDIPYSTNTVARTCLMEIGCRKRQLTRSGSGGGIGRTDRDRSPRW